MMLKIAALHKRQQIQLCAREILDMKARILKKI
jgi:hypothetical protein